MIYRIPKVSEINEILVMKNMCLLLSFIIVLTSLVFGAVSVSANSSKMMDKSEEELCQYANENNTWVVSYQQGKRPTSFFQYDATSEYLYFSYSIPSCVDVYDLHGTFLYSFIFPDSPNGGVCVRCEEDQVYISTKNHVLYIFNGIDEVACMDYEEATANGYDFFWFYENNPIITVNNDRIRWHGNNGVVVKEINTPKVIKQTIPANGIESIIKFVVLFFVVVLVAFIRRLIKRQ